MKYFRFSELFWAGPVDEVGNECGPGAIEIVLSTYEVLRRTPKGAWLDLGFGGRRFVRDSGKKRFACPTEEEAKESFRRRKGRQIAILTRQLESARLALELIERPENQRYCRRLS